MSRARGCLMATPGFFSVRCRTSGALHDGAETVSFRPEHPRSGNQGAHLRARVGFGAQPRLILERPRDTAVLAYPPEVHGHQETDHQRQRHTVQHVEP